jgi:hypothetical protein
MWRQWLRAKMNAFYAGHALDFPSLEPPPGEENPSDTPSIAWIQCVCDQMDSFYSDHDTPFPSLKPPPFFSDEAEFFYGALNKYYEYGMPWPGDWAFDEEQLSLFGTPRECEINFRTSGPRDRSKIYGSYYLVNIASSFRNLQSAIQQGRGCFESIEVIDFYCAYNKITDVFEIAYVNVRPCFQRKGLFTMYLFVVVEACVRSKRHKLLVTKVLSITRYLLSKLGFVSIGQDMYLDGEDAMQRALNLLSRAVKDSIRNLWDLDQQIKEQHQDGGCLNSQTPEVQQMLATRYTFFRYETYPDPEHVYYLVSDRFPTAEQLADPEYVQEQFPKPNTRPRRFAPGQV